MRVVVPLAALILILGSWPVPAAAQFRDDFLMDFDLPDAGRWHTVSMTTQDFEAGPKCGMARKTVQCSGS